MFFAMLEFYMKLIFVPCILMGKMSPTLKLVRGTVLEFIGQCGHNYLTGIQFTTPQGIDRFRKLDCQSLKLECG